MSYALTTSYGGTEAVIDDNCSINKFYAIADTLNANSNIKFLNQVDDAEALDWDFSYKKQLMTLHFSDFHGVTIIPQCVKNMRKENNAVLEVARYLEKMVF